MARTKSDNGVLRDLTNEITSTVKVLQSPVMERQILKDANAADVFVAGLRDALLQMTSVVVNLADTYRIDLTPDDAGTETEVTE